MSFSTTEEVEKLLKGLDTKKITGFYKTRQRLIKIAAEVLSVSLSK